MSDTYLTTVTLIGHLAWPAAVVTLAAGFRRQIAELLGRIRHIETPAGLSADLATEDAKVHEHQPAVGHVDMSGARELAATSPADAISQAWGVVTEANNAAHGHVASGEQHYGVLAQNIEGIESLIRDGKLDERFTGTASVLFDSFVRSHTEAADAKPDRAVAFISVAQQLGDALMEISSDARLGQ